MFCQLYKCYAFEAGSCEGRVFVPKSKDDPTMAWWWDCDCIEYVFDAFYDLGGVSAVRAPTCSSVAPAVASEPC